MNRTDQFISPHTVHVHGDARRGVLDIYFEDRKFTCVNVTTDMAHILYKQLGEKLGK